jgi:hypothetical protein
MKPILELAVFLCAVALFFAEVWLVATVAAAIFAWVEKRSTRLRRRGIDVER